MVEWDITIIGGGVIGCAIAREILIRRRDLKVCIIEKESEAGKHQSSRNSGVIHAGYNQKPGTLKAKLVVEGSRMLKEYCKKNRVPLFEGGIVVMAKNEYEMGILKELLHRGQQNGAKVELIDKRKLKEIEPHAKGVGGLHAPEGASFDPKIFVLNLAQEIKLLGATIFCGEEVINLAEKDTYILVETKKSEYKTKYLINCAGLQADRIAWMLGAGLDFHIIPFKGEYYEVSTNKRYIVKSHIYPVPDIKFPFLGIHISKRVNGEVIVGPSAVLALGRECYEKYSVNMKDVCEMVSSVAFWNMLGSRNFRMLALKELKKSFSKKAVVEEVQKLVEHLELKDLKPYPAGIRAQLVRKDGTLVDDLYIERTKNSLHILNAVSPALTCSLSFAHYIVQNILPYKF